MRAPRNVGRCRWSGAVVQAPGYVTEGDGPTLTGELIRDFVLLPGPPEQRRSARCWEDRARPAHALRARSESCCRIRGESGRQDLRRYTAAELRIMWLPYFADAAFSYIDLIGADAISVGSGMLSPASEAGLGCLAGQFPPISGASEVLALPTGSWTLDDAAR
jgi:hypothetical protein